MLFFLFSSFILSKELPYCNAYYSTNLFPEGYTLEHATILFKHGNRAPVDKIPGHEGNWTCSGENWIYPGGDAFNEDISFLHQFKIKPIPHQTFLKGTCRAGDLLESGIDQIKRLADYLKNTYKEIIPQKFQKRKINFRSTYTNRCLGSLQTIAHYLFKGSEPLDVFVSNDELETLVPNTYMCPALYDVMSKIQEDNQSIFYQNLTAFNSEVEKLQKEDNITAVPHWLRLGEMITTHLCNDVYLPKGFSNISQKSIDTLVNFYSALLNDEKGKKFGSGLLLFDIYLAIRDYLSGATNAQINFVSGHTLTLMSIEAALGLDLKFHAFGDFISIELLKKGNNRIVRVTENGVFAKQFNLPDFIKLAKELRPNEEECKVKYPFQEKDKKAPGTKILQMSFS